MLAFGDWRHDPNCKMGAANNSKSSNSAAQRGIAYHRKFYRAITQQLPSVYPHQRLLVEPWFKCVATQARRSPDTVLLDPATGTGLVIEVKMNWKEERDEKLLNEYLPIVKQAFNLETVWPLLVVGNIRKAPQKAIPWTPALRPLEEALSWMPGDPVPLALFVK